MRPLAILLVAALAGPALAAPAPAAPSAAALAAWAPLPDWSGVWVMNGAATFDRASPPYKSAWKAKAAKAIAAMKDGTTPDPIAACGTPAGMPRMMNLSRGYEWVITPKQVWEIAETGPNIRRIYTDGRPHPTGDDLFPQYTGHGIGHWEGATLVVDTVGLRDDTLLDRTGASLSDKAHVVERIRRTAPGVLEAKITIEDPDALTRPWTVTKTYRRLKPPAYVFDYACADAKTHP